MRPLLLLGALGCSSTTAAADNRASDDGPLVIELFTSQGCSSCPPAEALLNQLAKTGSLEGRNIAPLSFHVDYWNDLGWPDPYASPAWTARQQAYARALDDRVYTPELVVAGGAGVVGSQAGRVAKLVAAAPRQSAVVASASWEVGRVTVTATAPADADVWVAVWEDSTRTAVRRGENAGKTLANDRVVRKLERVATAGHAGTIEIALDGSWHASGAVAFAQRTDRRITGAHLLPVPAK
jgi:hypothetical protein